MLLVYRLMERRRPYIHFLSNFTHYFHLKIIKELKFGIMLKKLFVTLASANQGPCIFKFILCLFDIYWSLFIVTVSIQLWCQTDIKKRALKKKPCDHKDYCRSWWQTSISRRCTFSGFLYCLCNYKTFVLINRYSTNWKLFWLGAIH